MGRWTFVMALMLAACAEDVGEGKVKATVEAATPVAATPEAAATGKVLKVDAAKSTVGAVAAKVSAKHPITFPTFSGDVTMDGDAVQGVSFDVEMASLFADKEKLTAHLKDGDFFDVGAFPKATFKSTAVTPGGEGGTHTVTGDLTVRGTTKRISFPATVQVSPNDVSAKAEFVLDRKDFGIVYPGMADDLIQDNVVVNVQFVAPRA